MNVRNCLAVVTDGGTVRDGSGARVHYECRDCGKNLGPDADGCPRCDGGVASYEF